MTFINMAYFPSLYTVSFCFFLCTGTSLIQLFLSEPFPKHNLILIMWTLQVKSWTFNYCLVSEATKCELYLEYPMRRGGFTMKLMKCKLQGPSLTWTLFKAVGGAQNKYSLSYLIFCICNLVFFFLRGLQKLYKLQTPQDLDSALAHVSSRCGM
jgi:hypothetical protein